jgi:hypothetical protein
MLIFHKFVDVLRGASHEIPLRIIDGVMPGHISQICYELIDAEKFDFGPLPLEPIPDDPLSFAPPALTPVEWEAWCDGLVPLPAPISWFEVYLGNSRSGLLIREIDREWAITRLDWTNALFYDGHAIWISRDAVGQRMMAGDTQAIPARMTGPATLGEAVLSASQREQSEIYGSSARLAVYLALMLLSSSTEIRTELAPSRLNKSRIARGRTPLVDHRIVRIVPEIYLRARRAESGFTRLPPRLHYRRSHRRTYHRGEPGQFYRLIPRCLVNPGAEAEISHEYRIGTR